MKNFIRSSKRWVKRTMGPVVRSVGQTGAVFSPAQWGLTASPAVGLTLSGRSLHEMAQRWGSPLHVVDAEKLRRNVKAFTSVPQGADAGCEIYYSYKTNPVPGVLRLLHHAGVGAEVISHYEFWLARRLGVPSERIVYNGPAKSPASIREAIEGGISILNLNHRAEIGVVASIARELDKRIRVGLRVSTQYGWSAQFGTPIVGGEALAAYREALAEPSLEVVGVHAHRGGMIRHEHEMEAFVAQVLAFVDTLESELSFEPSILNFGGSLATPTVDHQRPVDQRLNSAFGRPLPLPDLNSALSIERYVDRVVHWVESHYESRHSKRPRIFLEPGRAMTGNAQLLLTTVLALKEAGDTTYAVLDAGINHAESVRNEYHQVFCVNRSLEPPSRRYTLVGPICTPGDTLYAAVWLPELAAGDTLAIMDAGAYFVPFSTSFSFPRPAIVLVDAGGESLLRRAEAFEDLVRCDDI